MNEPQREFYIRALVDNRVVITDMRIDFIGTAKGARLYILVAPRAAVSLDFALSVYEVAVAGNRLIHYAPVAPGVGVSRSDVLACLAGQVSAWKSEIFNDILDESPSSSEE